MAKGKRERPANPKDADVEITAGARVRKLRFEEAPEVRTRGSPGSEFASGSDRDNLPDRVEPDVTYRDASIRWRAASKLVIDQRLLEALEGEQTQGHGRDSGDPERENANPKQGRKDD